MGQEQNGIVQAESSNIIIVANSIPESDTMIGGYRIAIECAKCWLKSGQKVDFFTNSVGAKMITRYIRPEDTDLILSPVPQSLARSAFYSFGAAIPFYIWMTCSSLITARKAVLPEKTIIYSASPFWPDIFPGLLLRRRFRDSLWVVAMSMYAPPVLKGWRAHGEAGLIWPEKRAVALGLNQLSIYPFVKAWADGIIVNNDLDRLRAIRDGFAEGRVIVAGMGVENELAGLVEDPAGKDYDAVFIGRLHPQKGVLELIDIWQLFTAKHPGSRLAIIGNGPLEQKLRAKIEQKGLQGRVDMLGFLDGLDKIRILKASRVVIHSSLYDSGGMAALEAMSCGLPGVSYDLPDLAVYYPKGFLKTPCYDQAAFADNIGRLLNDAELYRQLQAEALDWARRWDWAEAAGRLLGFLRNRDD